MSFQNGAASDNGAQGPQGAAGLFGLGPSAGPQTPFLGDLGLPFPSPLTINTGTPGAGLLGDGGVPGSAPAALGAAELSERLHILLTLHQAQHSPSLPSTVPVSPAAGPLGGLDLDGEAALRLALEAALAQQAATTPRSPTNGGRTGPGANPLYKVSEQRGTERGW